MQRNITGKNFIVSVREKRLTVKQLRVTYYEKSSYKTQIRFPIFSMKLLIIIMLLKEYMRMMHITVLVNL